MGDTGEKATWRLRHWLALIGICFGAASPLAAFVEQRFATWALLAGVALILISVAGILTPDAQSQSDDNTNLP